MRRFHRGFAPLLSGVVILLAGLAAVVVTPPPRAEGQIVRPLMGANLAGTYVNQETGGFCYVYNFRGGYMFVSDFGERMAFAPVSANQLRSVRYNFRVPDILVTVDRNAYGRAVLVFEAPGKPAGYWVYAG